MVMAFNPDDPHDGHVACDGGFTYRMVHIWPEFFASLTGAGRPPDAAGTPPAGSGATTGSPPGAYRSAGASTAPTRDESAGFSQGIPSFSRRLLTDFADLPLVLSHPVHHNWVST
jgi:hypothetical protein